MNIAFILGSAGISGGTYVIFQHALYLKSQGHSVTCFTEDPISKGELDWHKEAKNLQWKTLDDVNNEKYDLTFATWWKTVYQLGRIPSHKYAYFCQSVESRFYPESEKSAQYWAETTYLAQLPVITEATWIQSYLKGKYGADVKLAKNGARKDIYRRDVKPIEPRDPNKLRVLIEGPFGVFFKNTEKTIALVKQSIADEVWLLTSSPIKAHRDVDRVFSRVPIEETAKIYSSCDVLVKLSYVEGMFGPPLEMFHCGGTAVVYNVSGHDEYMRPENSSIIETDDEAAVIAAINRYKNDPTHLASHKQKAIETADSWPGWNEASRVFASKTDEIYRSSVSPSQEYLKSFAQIAEDWFRIASSKAKTRPKELLRTYLPFLFRILRSIKNRIRYQIIGSRMY